MIPINDETIEKVADILAYPQVKKTNPKADSPIWGYHAFSQDQRSWLTNEQKDNARDILLALQEFETKDADLPYCRHCGDRIRCTRTFGWIHGVLGGGWNTSCADDENRAEPVDAWWINDE